MQGFIRFRAPRHRFPIGSGRRGTIAKLEAYLSEMHGRKGRMPGDGLRRLAAVDQGDRRLQFRTCLLQLTSFPIADAEIRMRPWVPRCVDETVSPQRYRITP